MTPDFLIPDPGWWVGMELNHHGSRGAFTAPWAPPMPSLPVSGIRNQWSGDSSQDCAALLITDYCLLSPELAEGEGVEPSTQRSARLSRPVAHHRAPPSGIRNQESGISDQSRD